MTKANLITAINTQLTAIITQAKVRLASLELVNELFPTEVIANDVVTNSFFLSNLTWKSSGNEARVYGTITNTSNAMYNNVNIAPIPIQFEPKFITQNFKVDNNFQVSLSSVTNMIRISTPIGSNQTILVNITFQIND